MEEDQWVVWNTTFPLIHDPLCTSTLHLIWIRGWYHDYLSNRPVNMSLLSLYPPEVEVHQRNNCWKQLLECRKLSQDGLFHMRKLLHHVQLPCLGLNKKHIYKGSFRNQVPLEVVLNTNSHSNIAAPSQSFHCEQVGACHQLGPRAKCYQIISNTIKSFQTPTSYTHMPCWCAHTHTHTNTHTCTHKHTHTCTHRHTHTHTYIPNVDNSAIHWVVLKAGSIAHWLATVAQLMSCQPTLLLV